MEQEKALERVKIGSIVIYEGASNEIHIGEVESVSEYGSINVHDIDEGRGHYFRTPEEYFLYEIDEDEYHLNVQIKEHNRFPSKEERFWYKLCLQNARRANKYLEELNNLKYHN